LVQRRFATLEPAEADVFEGAIGEGMQNVPSRADQTIENDAPDGKLHEVRTSRSSASVDGFSIRADTAVEPHHRVGLPEAVPLWLAAGLLARAPLALRRRPGLARAAPPLAQSRRRLGPEP